MLLKYQIGITLIPGVGDVNGKKLISYCGSAEAVFNEKKKALLKIPGIGESTVAYIVSQNVLARAEEEIEFIEDNKETDDTSLIPIITKYNVYMKKQKNKK